MVDQRPQRGCRYGRAACFEIGALLRRLRTEARLTQEELAEAAGLSPRDQVSDLERGVNRTARKDTAELLASALGVAGRCALCSWRQPRGRAPAADVLATLGGEALAWLASTRNAWEGCPSGSSIPDATPRSSTGAAIIVRLGAAAYRSGSARRACYW